jgi:tRNA modification GTPase
MVEIKNITAPDLYAEQTIIAQCTPRGAGAIALLRLSGHDALTIAARMSKLYTGTLDTVPSHTVHVGHVCNEQGQPIDQVMFLVMHAPKTFTGEHVVEITCHNNPFIIEAIIARAIAVGARMAREGEFCKRAVMHGKMDLVQAEAINELIHAHTLQALKKSLAQVEGSFSRYLHTIEQELIKATAFCQASFEFIEEEQLEFGPQIKEIIEQLLAQIAQLKVAFDQQQRIKEGYRIACIGSVNAGKSSLFNALLAKERAIVTPIAGTTRDVIEAGMYQQQEYWTLVDTAGLRQTDDVIEQAGIERSYKEAEQADVVLLIIDASRAMTGQEEVLYRELFARYQTKTILVYTKADLTERVTRISDGMTICTSDKTDVARVQQAIQEQITRMSATHDYPFVLNARQFNILLDVEHKLQTLLPMLQGRIAYELLYVHLQEVIEQLSQLTGKTVSELCMDRVFREFCVGK